MRATVATMLTSRARWRQLTPPWSPFILAESQRGSNGIIGSNTVTYRSAIHDPRREPARFRRFNRSRYKPREEARRRKASHARSDEAEMPPTRRAGFHPLAREPKSTVQIGDVRYYDGAELSRPLEMPPRVKAIMLAAMVVAAVVGCLFFGALLRPDHERAHPPAADAAGQLGPRGFLRLPFALFAHAAFRRGDHDRAYRCRLHFVRAHPVGTDPDGGFEVIKLPADVSLEEAGSCTFRASTSCRPATP